jgi:hypothetical protein
VPVTESKGSLGGQEFSHPGFGAITVSRISGSTVLFGVGVRPMQFVRVSIYPNKVVRDLSREWYLHDNRPIISIDMSEAQWATFVSSFSVGSGVPCTINWNNGPVEKLDWAGVGTKKTYADELKAKMRKVATGAAALVAKLTDLLKQPSIKKGDVAALRKDVEGMVTALTSNMPFVQEQFEEAMEGMVEHAKAEIHAYHTNAVMKLGLRAMAEGMSDEEKRLLLAAPEVIE